MLWTCKITTNWRSSYRAVPRCLLWDNWEACGSVEGDVLCIPLSSSVHCWLNGAITTTNVLSYCTTVLFCYIYSRYSGGWSLYVVVIDVLTLTSSPHIKASVHRLLNVCLSNAILKPLANSNSGGDSVADSSFWRHTFPWILDWILSVHRHHFMKSELSEHPFSHLDVLPLHSQSQGFSSWFILIILPCNLIFRIAALFSEFI